MMPGYYPIHPREPFPMPQAYPPSRSYSLAKLNQMPPRDHGIYEKVRMGGMDRRPQQKPSEKLRRQQSYDENMNQRMFFQMSRRPDGFESLQTLNGQNEDRFLEKLMYENSRGRTLTRDHDSSKLSSGVSTLLSNKSKSSKKNKENKENRRTVSLNSVAMALIGSLAAKNKSEDDIYESVEQIHYRKTIETMNRKEKIRDVQRSGHPLFDHLREERAIASGSKSTGPSRKASTANSPLHSSNSSGDEQEVSMMRRGNAGRIYQSRNEVMRKPERKISQPAAPTWRRAGSAGSESDDDWAIPRPKIGGRRRDARVSSTDESDSSSKSSPMR